MKKILGIFGLLVVVIIITALWNPRFLIPFNVKNTLRWTGLFGIISIGAMFVIITGGIDLSIGSVIGLAGVLFSRALVEQGLSPWLAVPCILAITGLIGLAHGLLITKLKLQPFVVTLCGLMICRSAARYLGSDSTHGFAGLAGLKKWIKGSFFENCFGTSGGYDIPMAFVYMIVIAIVASVFLNLTVWGRYLYALGNNEEATRLSGVRTDRIVILAYVVCGILAGFGGMMFAVDVGSVQPSTHGNFYELYAIAAAVLGGCSLRGGEGAVLGVIFGSAMLRVLYNAINMLEIPTELELTVIGLVILAGVIADELIKRRAASRHLKAT